jgi:hypothetical protein
MRDDAHCAASASVGVREAMLLCRECDEYARARETLCATKATECARVSVRNDDEICAGNRVRMHEREER